VPVASPTSEAGPWRVRSTGPNVCSDGAAAVSGGPEPSSRRRIRLAGARVVVGSPAPTLDAGGGRPALSCALQHRCARAPNARPRRVRGSWSAMRQRSASRHRAQSSPCERPGEPPGRREPHTPRHASAMSRSSRNVGRATYDDGGRPMGRPPFMATFVLREATASRPPARPSHGASSCPCRWERAAP